MSSRELFISSPRCTWQDKIVDSLFFCATLTGRRGGHILIERMRPTPVPRRLNRTQAVLGRATPWGGCRCRRWKCEVLQGCPPTLRSIGDLPSASHVCCCCQINWWVVVQRVVSIWSAVHLHSMDGWALSEADVQAVACRGLVLPGKTSWLEAPLPNFSIEQWRMVVIVTGYTLLVTSQYDVIFTFANHCFGDVFHTKLIFFQAHSPCSLLYNVSL